MVLFKISNSKENCSNVDYNSNLGIKLHVEQHALRKASGTMVIGWEDDVPHQVFTFQSQLCLQCPFPGNAHPGRQQATGPTTWVLATPWRPGWRSKLLVLAWSRLGCPGNLGTVLADQRYLTQYLHLPFKPKEKKNCSKQKFRFNIIKETEQGLSAIA